MSYLLLKHLHVSCVVLSGIGFLLRGLWMLRGSPLLGHRLTRILPHLIDSSLLGSALLLAWLSGQYPFMLDWLTGKFFGLLAYIVLGALALKRAPTLRGRALCLVLAVVAYGYIVSVAMTRNPWPWA
ncbi:SirB2 family protein [Dechloromonas sp. ZY10]|uniref:SirB2 family protein n=1 Tax=Dechloromonas aquae TaxID=2664436 RepID=UPI003527DD62